MTKTEAFNIDLPKWPQCVITGKPVSKEQAMEIILRTDNFFQGYEGNDREFITAARAIVGLPTEDYYTLEYGSPEWNEYKKKWNDFREKTKNVRLNILSNSWISCTWIGGPHGWCSPDGEIGFQNNIGKWPSVQDVYEDLETIGKEFPYVELTCTLINSEEGCYDEDTKTLVTMQLKDGEVTIYDEPIPLDQLEYKGVGCSASLLFGRKENAISLQEIAKYWGNLVNS